MEISIRHITEQDAETVNELSRQLGYVMPLELTISNIKTVLAHKSHDAFVAVSENKVIGWISVAEAIQLVSAPCCEIRGLIVDEKYRGQGVGKLLIEKAKQWTKETGNKALRVRCNTIRKEAHVFYRRLGFKETKEQKNFEINV